MEQFCLFLCCAPSESSHTPTPSSSSQATFKRLLTCWCWPWGKEPLLFAHKLDKSLNFPTLIFRHGAGLLRMLIGLIWIIFVFHWKFSRKMQILCLLRRPRPFRLIVICIWGNYGAFLLEDTLKIVASLGMFCKGKMLGLHRLMDWSSSLPMNRRRGQPRPLIALLSSVCWSKLRDILNRIRE